jgi:hypothetical protein
MLKKGSLQEWWSVLSGSHGKPHVSESMAGLRGWNGN